MRMNDPRVNIWIIAEKDGTIISAHCLGCKAGLAESCSHVASVMFYIEAVTLKDNEQYTFCQNDTETLIHLFWTCSVSTAFWQDFKQWAVNRGELSNTINLTAYLVLGLNLNKNKRLDFYFLIARFFLWVCKTCTWILPTYANEVPYAKVGDIDFSSAKKLKGALEQKIETLNQNTG